MIQNNIINHNDRKNYFQVPMVHLPHPNKITCLVLTHISIHFQEIKLHEICNIVMVKLSYKSITTI